MLRLSRKHLICKFKRRRKRWKVETEEESRPWSDLPALVLERIRASLDSDLYDLRLRSVCGDWRRSLASTRDAYGFPIQVPPFPDREVDGKSIHRNYLYLISPAEDLSHGWLVRSLGIRPNTFTLSKPLHPERVRCPLGTIDLLNFRISEVCSCFAFDTSEADVIRRVVVVPYFVKKCAVTVMVLTNTDNRICYWNDHDPNWTYMDQLGHIFEDMTYFEGLFYALDGFGALFYIDSSFHLTEVVPPSNIFSDYYTDLTCHYLIPYNSQLFLVALVTKEKYSAEPYGRLVFKLMDNFWSMINLESLKDMILLGSSDVAGGICSENMKAGKGQFYCLISFNLPYIDNGTTNINETDFAVYYSEEDDGNIFWPPPNWILPIA